MRNFEDIYEEIKSKYNKNFAIKRRQVKKERAIYVLIYILYIVSVLVIGYMTIKNNSNIDLLCLFVIDILIIPYIPIFIYRRWGKNVKYKREYTKLILGNILSKFKEIKEYNYNKGIEKSKYREADFDKYDNIYKSRCLVNGVIDQKYNFEMSNVYTKNLKLFTLTMDYSYVFDGTVIILDIPKRFKERVFITKQSKFRLGEPDIVNEEYNMYCKDKSKNTEKINMKLVKKILGTKLFDEIVLKDDKIYLRSANNVFEVPNLKEKPLNKERIYNYFNTYENILDNLKKIVKEI